MPQPELINVSLGTEHKVYKVRKGLYIAYTLSMKAIYLFIALFISYKLYKECLFDKECNLIVTTYFCVLGLAFFANVGLPIDKLANIKLIS